MYDYTDNLQRAMSLAGTVLERELTYEYLKEFFEEEKILHERILLVKICIELIEARYEDWGKLQSLETELGTFKEFYEWLKSNDLVIGLEDAPPQTPQEYRPFWKIHTTVNRLRKAGLTCSELLSDYEHEYNSKVHALISEQPSTPEQASVQKITLAEGITAADIERIFTAMQQAGIITTNVTGERIAQMFFAEKPQSLANSYDKAKSVRNGEAKGSKNSERLRGFAQIILRDLKPK